MYKILTLLYAIFYNIIVKKGDKMRKNITFKFCFLLVSLLCFSTCFLQVKSPKSVLAYNHKIYGNDISHWQGNVNFETMKKVSDFVIIRIGYSTKLDNRFLEYMNMAKKANLDIGIYIYSLAKTPNQAINEANWVASILRQYGYDNGYLNYPVFFDFEETDVITANTSAYNTKIVNAFVDTISSYGYYAGLYMGGYYFENHIIEKDIKCDIWLAHYFNDMRDVNKFKSLHPSTKVTMWQFGADGYNTVNTGKTCGVSSSVIDENYCFVNYPEIIIKGGYNGHKIFDIPDNNDQDTVLPDNSVPEEILPEQPEDLPVFKPDNEMIITNKGCSSDFRFTFGIIGLPFTLLTIYIIARKKSLK